MATKATINGNTVTITFDLGEPKMSGSGKSETLAYTGYVATGHKVNGREMKVSATAILPFPKG